MQQSRRPLKPAILFGIVMLCAAVALGLFTLWSQRQLVPGSGTALVGGPFTMVNHRGETVTADSFRGKPMLLFFGFTFCPDICPTELQVMAAALDDMGREGADIQPLFVSVDPARDTPEVMKAYVEHFGPRFTGLTGSAAQVAAMASAYRVHFEVKPNPSDPASYTVDHSAIIYLMDAKGQFLKHFSYTTDPKTLADALRKALGRG
jgi:cytochrome oxidase Cu insertion factor (SCO1/SenC/PrrC family)